MAYFSGTCPQWGPGFHIDADANDGRIRLAQCGRKTFALESTIRYSGTTGLEDVGLPPASLEELREVTPADLPETDLASIPPPMRWWVNSYGVHTPAAIIHDRFIGGDLPEGVTEQHIDRYFRFMLADAGVTIGKRWIMWRRAGRGGSRSCCGWSPHLPAQRGPLFRYGMAQWVRHSSPWSHCRSSHQHSGNARPVPRSSPPTSSFRYYSCPY